MQLAATSASAMAPIPQIAIRFNRISWPADLQVTKQKDAKTKLYFAYASFVPVNPISHNPLIYLQQLLGLLQHSNQNVKTFDAVLVWSA
jgi:hypothetical protein